MTHKYILGLDITMANINNIVYIIERATNLQKKTENAYVK